MVVFAIAAGALLALLVTRRELRLAQQHRALCAHLRHLQQTQQQLHLGLGRNQDDGRVLRQILIDRRLIDDAELARGHQRLVEQAQLAQAQRQILCQSFGGRPTHAVLDDQDASLH